MKEPFRMYMDHSRLGSPWTSNNPTVNRIAYWSFVALMLGSVGFFARQAILALFGF